MTEVYLDKYRGSRISSQTDGTVSSIRQSLTISGYVCIAIAVIIYSYYDDRTFLGDVNVDGYTAQVQYIWNYFNGGNSILDLEPLLWIHALRALIAYLFVSLEEIGGNALVVLALMILTVPILQVFSVLERGYLILVLPLIEVGVSERTFLVIIATAYLVIFIRNGRSAHLLPISFILSNLSSGSVMNNLIISSTVARKHRVTSKGLYLYIVALVISFIISVADKYQGFSEQRAGYDSTVYGASGFEAILSRSTIFVSWMDGNYARVAVYVFIATVALGLMIFALKNRQYRGYAVIMLSVIPSLIFEGLGFMSLLVPILLFLAGEKLPWRPQDREKAAD